MAVDNKFSIFNICKEYISKTASTASGKCFNRLEQFFYLNCAGPQIIIHDIGYILYPSIEHFHNIPFSLFSRFLKSLRYYKLFCVAEAGTRRRNDIIQTST